MKAKSIAALALGALLLAGCGGSSDPAPDASPTAGDTPSASSSSPVPTAASPESTYQSVRDLVDAAVEAGYPCPNFTQSNQVKLALESGACSDFDVFSVYGSRDDMMEVANFLGASGGTDYLMGGNWIINGNLSWLRTLKRTLGGAVHEATAGSSTAPGGASDGGTTDWKPNPKDFKVSVSVVRKQCFGSAGCNVTLRVAAPRYVGKDSLPDTGVIEVTYEIKGAQEETIGSFTVEGGRVSYQDEWDVQTKASSSKLSAVVTGATYTP